MKRKFLILSAVLFAVAGAVMLQSCSSEYEFYEETEEYGYYTEEEIAAIKALGEVYGVTINIDENTYEVKKTLPEFEEEIKYHASLIGEYEVFYDPNDEEDKFLVRKKEADLPRMLTRSAENNQWDYTFHKGIYNLSLSISWKESTGSGLGYATGSIKATSATNDYYGKLNCQLGFYGTKTVTFSGHIMLGYYTYKITQGTINITTKDGSFFFENDFHKKMSNNSKAS